MQHTKTLTDDPMGLACDHSIPHTTEEIKQAIETINDKKIFSAKKNSGNHNSARKNPHDKYIAPRYAQDSVSPILALFLVAFIIEPKLNPSRKKKRNESRFNIQIGGIAPIPFNLCIISMGLPNALMKKT